mmetsp:Transcript_44698/g.121826  ORF Transcript_44698/g.121826 Transcript_44698/m.121826 type:complete len:116 (+) Transcript_44698:352-699(+)
MVDISEACCGITFLMKMKMARSGGSLMRFRITYLAPGGDGSLAAAAAAAATAATDKPGGNIHELTHGEIRRYEVLLLVDVGDVRLIRLFANHLDKKLRGAVVEPNVAARMMVRDG